MLTQRTNVLLNEHDYKMLKELSKKHHKSVGELIRHAVITVYKEEKPSRAQLLKKFKELGKNFDTKGINIKELVEYGRR
ncbi:hypothetical protein COT86_01890 [Candidatus Collierbacteria bacterium CG10_big_fil_rev_8_21_14_0_10_43_36]|uniref:Ribbon-helix-helix protein CopG domain-containing protein n=3 Tax=Candidatus Collieribacteriota TaxID=1752725 RepID=A0A2H0DT87_9BACT|nr:MAG: hypothetical protein COW83_04815 [Candidatus Collierbacteria bacterium CG22_combo_CG10-13_8_21_14_all_43_12]PIR99839.1 MAG: hypothetical protein COT86_01890 [Candidatus Collierbacteria bacterium CG10_big_fil_rev_8_21_14_0_10_43_36]PIZ24140.1 MAG: hypothetical protein COY48_04535 [Candidatus Collierbacteria bacterium CG_4_10_14_0_8_um_filter_43_86]PJB46967.1 MAG: hypothetical protein CO104_04935 [Candidatus Collierbacteria bacterium CG_4_9_14_3_um_filter_43_16]